MRNFAEEFFHFRRGLEIHLLGVMHALFVKDIGSGANADHGVVERMVPLVEEVDVVGGDRFQIELAAPFHELTIAYRLILHAVIVQLQVKVFIRVNIPKIRERGLCLINLPLAYELVDLAIQTAAEANHPFAKLMQNLLVHSWLVVETVQMRLGNELHEILIALLVAGEKRQVRGIFTTRGGGFVVHRPWGKVNFTTNDRLDSSLLGSLVKLDRAKHIAMVRHRHSRHAEFFRPRHQLRNAHGAIKR